MIGKPESVLALQLGDFPPDDVGRTLREIAVSVADLVHMALSDDQYGIRNKIASARLQKQSLEGFLRRKGFEDCGNVHGIVSAIWESLDAYDRLQTPRVFWGREEAEASKSHPPSQDFQRFLDGGNK